MILNTGRLFRRLLRTLDIETVYDIGSMDGADALRFRRVLPDATIFALEPNPENYALMNSDKRLADASIECLPVAASDRADTLPFYVVEANYARGCDQHRRGMSSLHKRSRAIPIDKVVQVDTVRLDGLIDKNTKKNQRIALWVDTEGSAFEVIQGAEAMLPSTSLIHVEVETDAIIGATQKLFADVNALLTNHGFVLIAIDKPTRNLQFNALFVCRDSRQSKRLAIGYWSSLLWFRRVLSRPFVLLLPNTFLRWLTRPRY